VDHRASTPAIRKPPFPLDLEHDLDSRFNYKDAQVATRAVGLVAVAEHRNRQAAWKAADSEISERASERKYCDILHFSLSLSLSISSSSMNGISTPNVRNNYITGRGRHFIADDGNNVELFGRKWHRVDD